MGVVEKPSCKSFHTTVDKEFKGMPLEGNLPTAGVQNTMNDPLEHSISAFKTVLSFN